MFTFIVGIIALAIIGGMACLLWILMKNCQTQREKIKLATMGFVCASVYQCFNNAGMPIVFN